MSVYWLFRVFESLFRVEKICLPCIFIIIYYYYYCYFGLGFIRVRLMVYQLRCNSPHCSQIDGLGTRLVASEKTRC